MWSGYVGKQPNDPDKLGEALVKLSNMAAPPRFFVAGPDALDAIGPVMEARLKEETKPCPRRWSAATAL